MDLQQIHAALAAHRVKAQAFDTLTAKVQAHFEGSKPSPAELEAYIASVYVWDKLGMTQAEFYQQPLNWRHEQGQKYAPPPPPVHSRRPVMRDLTAAELAQLQREGLKGAAYTERARALQQTPAPKPDAI